MCDCQSYNHPDLGGETKAIILSPPAWSNKNLICVDACMANTIEWLWSKGIVTLGCCCGHNGRLGRATIIVDHPYIMPAKDLLTREVDVLAWVSERLLNFGPGQRYGKHGGEF